jgi:hypothetical protein
MGAIETISYAEHISPVRCGLRWLATGLVITLPIAALFLRSDAGAFAFVCVCGVLPVAVIAFISPWSRARALANTSKTVSVSPTAITVAGVERDLKVCRWFRGYAFHDPELALYPASTPAIVVVWPPFNEECRTICGLDPQRREEIIQTLERAGVPEDRPRSLYERIQINAVTVAGAGCTALATAGINRLLFHGIPDASIATSVIVGGIAARMAFRHGLGHFQCQDVLAKTLGPWFGVVFLGLFRINRKLRGAQLLADPGFLISSVALAALQALGLYALYAWIRARENRLLTGTTATGNAETVPQQDR